MTTQKELHRAYIARELLERRIYPLIAMSDPEKYAQSPFRLLNCDLLRLIFGFVDVPQSRGLTLVKGVLVHGPRSTYTIQNTLFGCSWQTPIFSWIVSFMSKETMPFWSLRTINRMYEPDALPRREDLRLYFEVFFERHRLIQDGVRLGTDLLAHQVAPKFEYMHWMSSVVACECFRRSVSVTRWFEKGFSRRASGQILLWETSVSKSVAEAELGGIFGGENLSRHVLVKDMAREKGCLIFIGGAPHIRSALQADCLFPAFNAIAAQEHRVIALASNKKGFTLGL